jgi:hypothetical protein
VVAGTDGRVRYIIAKPLTPGAGDVGGRNTAVQRYERQRHYLAITDLADPQLTYGDEAYARQRSRLRMRLASLHQGVTR